MRSRDRSNCLRRTYEAQVIPIRGGQPRAQRAQRIARTVSREATAPRRWRPSAGGKLWARMNGPRNIVLQDKANNVSTILVYDVYQSNGVMQVVDRVLMPKM
jgi:hypothetical protein